MSYIHSRTNQDRFTFDEAGFIAEVEDDFIAIDGSNKMKGHLDMNKHRITNIKNPEDNDDAISKRYFQEHQGRNDSLLTGIQAYYNFDKIDDYFNDAVGLFNGSPQGGEIDDDGKIKKGYKFDGSKDSHIEFPEDTFNIQGNDYSISLWVKPQEPSDKQFLYVGTGNGEVKKIDPETETEIWSEEHFDDVYAVKDFDGFIYAGAGDNHVKKINAKTGQEVWSFDNDTTVLTIDVDDDGVYIGDGFNRVRKLNIDTGNFVWTYHTGNDVVDLIVHEGSIFLISLDNTVRKLDKNGVRIWIKQSNISSYGGIDIRGDHLYHAHGDNKVVRRKLSDGSDEITFTDVPDNIISAIKWVDEYLYIIDISGKLYKIKDIDPLPAMSEHVWTYDSGDPNLWSVTANKNYVFVGSQGGNIYKVNADNGNEVWKIETDSNIIRALDLGKNDFQTLISTGGDDENRMNLMISEKVYLKTYSNGNLRRVISDEKITLDEWNHILVTVMDDTAILYLNGNIVGSGDVHNENDTTGTTFEIGTSKYYAPADGTIIDEVGLWIRPLTEEEINHLYNHGDGFNGFLTNNTRHINQDMNMTGRRIKNVASPIEATDGVNKDYADKGNQCFLESKSWVNETISQGQVETFSQTINLPDTGDWLVTMNSFIGVGDSGTPPLCYIEIDGYKVSDGADGVFDPIGVSRDQINFNSWQRIISGKSSFDVKVVLDNSPNNDKTANILFNTTCLKVNKID